MLFCNKSLGESARRNLAPSRHYFDTLLTPVFVATTFDGLKSFFFSRVSNIRNACKHQRYAGFLHTIAESWKNLKDTITFSSFSFVRSSCA